MMHSAHSNNNIGYMKKNIGVFPLCGGCSRRERREGLKDGEFYCSVATDILPNGVVTNDIDATECVRNGSYKPTQ